ncbi:MAG TPA: coenzyme F420-0:L-glutamate ligase [Xanthobacteraceae bacterium]|nr:coenzyme F420-0:L-glutamate ligase [Xanthobacteraceae bacterium]
MGGLTLTPLRGVPRVGAGDDIERLTLDAVAASQLSLQDGDLLVYAQKIISKAEGRLVALSSVTPSAEAVRLAGITQKDPKVIELVLSESREVLRARPGVIIVEHNLGFVLANAGIDRSNVDGADHALLLPLDPDGSARRIRDAIAAETKADIGVLIIDSIGRAWRNGTVGTLIGSSGIPALLDLRGKPDLFGRALETTEVGWGDEMASAASLVMGQAAEGFPVVHVRGASILRGEGVNHDLLRPKSKDLFR